MTYLSVADGYENLFLSQRKGPKYSESLSYPALLQLMQKLANCAVWGSLNRVNKQQGAGTQLASDQCLCSCFSCSPDTRSAPLRVRGRAGSGEAAPHYCGRVPNGSGDAIPVLSRYALSTKPSSLALFSTDEPKCSLPPAELIRFRVTRK